MSDPGGLTGPEQRAILIMARWADEAGLRRCRWSLPNDASWPHSHLAGLPVRHDGLPNQYDLLARTPWRPERVVCSLHRSTDGYEVTGVPGEEWLRREPEPRPAASPARPRLRLTAAAVGLLVPASVLGGLAVATTAGQQDPPAALAPTRVEPAPAPPLPANADEWATSARVRLAAMSQQLETLTAAEAAWTALPPERRAGEPPAEVTKLQSALAELAQRRAALAAELDALDALHEARTDLAATEERLAEARSALALGDTTASDQLREQTDRLARQSAEQRGQFASRQRNVDAAIAEPLPEPVDAAPTADAVLALAENPPASEQEAPLVAAGREVEPDDSEPQDGDDEPEPDSDADRDVIEVPEVDEDADKDAAPVDVKLPSVVPDVDPDEPGPSNEAPAPEPEPDGDDAGIGEIDASPPAELPQDWQPEVTGDAPSEWQSAITPAEQEQINQEINTKFSQLGAEIDAFVDSHGDEISAAVDRMEDITLDDLVRHDGETDQELRERLTEVAQDYQRQAEAGR
ncbi:MAG: hypothetical protein GEU83_13915 [Pseudonocardiaceae bacterium]|nr:hypothetical protein [Pseudonocardiaceae bacterium]